MYFVNKLDVLQSFSALIFTYFIARNNYFDWPLQQNGFSACSSLTWLPRFSGEKLAVGAILAHLLPLDSNDQACQNIERTSAPFVTWA